MSVFAKRAFCNISGDDARISRESGVVRITYIDTIHLQKTEVESMKIIKRSGMEVEFDRSKINNAVKKANNSVVVQDQMSDAQIEEIAKNVEIICEGMAAR